MSLVTCPTEQPCHFLGPSAPLAPCCLAPVDPPSMFWSTASPGVTGLAAYSWKQIEILLRGHFASRSGGKCRKP